jgi:TniQ
MSFLTRLPRARREFFQRWDEPREHEPAHAYLSRLAGLNLQTSARVFAEEMGLDGRQLPPNACLDAVRHLPIAGLDRLIDATPIVTKRRVQFLGSSVRRKHWSGDEPRWCPGCIAESPHYRVYHGLLSFTVCPFHGAPIEIGTGGDDSLSWRHPSLALTPDGRRIGRKMHRHDEPIPSFERWVLGQLGVIEPWPLPILDGAALDQAIDTVAVLGRAAVCGWSRQAPRIRPGGLTRRDVVARGFEVLSGGIVEIEALFERVASEAGDRRGPKGCTWGLNHSFGWLFTAVLNGHQAGQHLPVVKAALETVARRQGTYARQSTALEHAESECAYLLREEVARRVGIQPRLVDRIAKRLNIHVDVQRERFVMYARDDVDRIEHELSDALERDRAADQLGLSLADFKVIEAAGIVQPICRLGGGDAKHDRFRRFDLEALISSVATRTNAVGPDDGLGFAAFVDAVRQSPGKIASMIGAGHLVPVRRDPTLPGFHGLYLSHSDVKRLQASTSRIIRAGGRERRPARATGVAYCDAQAMLGVEAITLQTLVAQGYIDIAERENEESRVRVSEASLEEFKSSYSPAVAYASALGCSRKTVIRRMRELGVKIHLRPQGERSSLPAFVARSEVVQAFNLKQDPLAQRNEGWIWFWQNLARYLTERNSVFRLVRAQDRAAARLLTGDRRSSCIITVQILYLEKNTDISVDQLPRKFWTEVFRRLTTLASEQRSQNPERSRDKFTVDEYELTLEVMRHSHRAQREKIQISL